MEEGLPPLDHEPTDEEIAEMADSLSESTKALYYLAGLGGMAQVRESVFLDFLARRRAVATS
jgi:hypothetical protein